MITLTLMLCLASSACQMWHWPASYPSVAECERAAMLIIAGYNAGLDPDTEATIKNSTCTVEPDGLRG